MMIVLFFFTTFTYAIGLWEPELGVYWVPTPITPWKAATHNNLICPPPATRISTSLSPSFNYTVPNPRNLMGHMQHDGWLCVSSLYATTCDTNFWGHQTITQSNLPVRMTSAACKKAVREHILGELAPPRYPDPYCYWMASHTQAITQIRVIEHPVTSDLYTETFVNSLFPGTHCAMNPCTTVHPDTMWETTTIIKKDCKILPNSNFTGYKDPRRPDREWVVIDNDSAIYLAGSCHMQYCGQKGLRTASGQWIPYEGPTKYPDCPESWLTRSTEHSNELKVNLEVQEVESRRACIEATQRIRDGAPISFHLLSYFQPRRTGYYHVYRIYKGILQYSKAWYEPLKDLNPSGKYTLGHFPNSSIYKIDPVRADKNGTLSAFNGVHVAPDGTIIVPEVELFKDTYSDTLLYQKARLIDHPATAIQANYTTLVPHYTSTTSFHRPDLTAWGASVWSAFWGKVMLISMAVASVLIIYVAIKCVPWAAITRRRAQPMPAVVTYTPSNSRVNW
ncbi:glycoprotein [New Minto virus]|uniref:Glycoprotein n=1 Tax=New Minto virus TaxID=1272952 RepID=A0A0D3R1Y5_9RHAB|nr:glycoprotein [New Minto virus]AJR28475.1 glycoprotein [New Minto virus]